ncbi:MULTISPECIES: DUF6418 domain-containing protein [unclassified Pannonibacter]|uniref:DUF6418 domain-containing protein n=1 Tax=unclassified Pannonibacter TaxID=2627228 RepID=UPI0016450298|nr:MULTISPECIES: DUF6418 domain-containing protein [unclassified Pannonibacter]
MQPTIKRIITQTDASQTAGFRQMSDRKNVLLSVKTGHIFFLATLGAFLEIVFVSYFWSFYACGLLFIYIYTSIQKSPENFILYTHVVLTKILVVISLLFISLGYYMPELGRFGTPKVGANAFLVFSIILFYTAERTLRVFQKRNSIKRAEVNETSIVKIITFLILATSASLILYLVYFGLSNGFPLLQGIDRFGFRMSNEDKIFLIVINLKSTLMCALGLISFCYNCGALLKIASKLSFSIWVIVSILFGDKFFSLIVLFLYYYTPYLVMFPSRFSETITRNTFKGMIIVCLALGIVCYVYSDYGVLGWEATIERLFGRFASQGQLWAMVYRDFQQILSFGQDSLHDYVAVMFSSNASEKAFNGSVGIFHLMALYAPANIILSVQEMRGNVQFTGAFEAYFIMTSGYLGTILILLVAGVYLGLSAAYLKNAIFFGSPFSTGVAVFNMLNCASALNQGSLWQILGSKALIYFGILVLLDVLHRVFIRSMRI